MQLALFFATATLIAIFSPVLNADDNACQLPKPVKGFWASAYTALTVSTDPEILKRLELTGGEAAMLLSKNINADLGSHYHLCNAEVVAFSCSRGLTTISGNETLPDFYKKTSIAIGQVLYNNRVLSCGNDVSLGMRLYTYIKKALKDRDATKFDDYLYASVKGVNQLFSALGLDLGNVTQQTANVFSQEYIDESGNKCNIMVSN